MKSKLVGALIVLVCVFGMKIVYDRSQTAQCDAWFGDATTSEQQGLYATSLDILTLYFSTHSCRGGRDPQAIQLLASARFHVPIPGNAHLAQQLMLSRLGLQLGKVPKDNLATASAHLVHGHWSKAQKAALDTAGPQASLITLAAAIGLNDAGAIDTALSQVDAHGASPFAKALIHKLMRSRGLPLLQAMSSGEKDYELLAAFIVSPNDTILPASALNILAQEMSLQDIAAASSLLTAKGQFSEAISLLNQPGRPLTEGLIIRLARLYWLQNNMQELVSQFLKRRVTGAIPAEVYFVVCLAQRRQKQACNIQFNATDYRQRYGKYATSQWQTLFVLLTEKRWNHVALIDALNDMPDLIKSNGVAMLFKAHLMETIGEKSLAQKYMRLAEAIGYQGSIEDVHSLEAPIPACEQTDFACFTKNLTANPGDFRQWRKAIIAGFKPGIRLAQKLRAASPSEATLWRRVLAQALIHQASDENIAEALVILRPVIDWVPEHTTPRLLLAAAYFHFEDKEATLVQLSATVRQNPGRAVEALRLALGFYQTKHLLSPSQLVHWWHAMTLLEVQARGIDVSPPQAKALITERLSLLAAIAEEKRDHDLSIAAYERLLQTDTTNHMALNNLAYRLIEKKGHLRRALNLAQQAVTLLPQQKEYRHTLAAVQAAITAQAS